MRRAASRPMPWPISSNPWNPSGLPKPWTAPSTVGTTGEAERERENILRVARESPKVPAPDRMPQTRPAGAHASGTDLLVPGGRRRGEGAHGNRYIHRELPARRAGGQPPGGSILSCPPRSAGESARIREIRPYFKSGFLLVMPDAAATEIVVSERQARSLRQRHSRPVNLRSLPEIPRSCESLRVRRVSIEPSPIAPYLRCRRET